MMLRGIKGTFVYACDKNLREYFEKHISIYIDETPAKIIPLFEKGENCVPIYDIKTAAGGFSELQQSSNPQWIKLPGSIPAKEDHFVCQVIGESMNKKIPNRSLCLFQKDPGGSREGKIVLVEHRNIYDADFGAGYTVKSYHSTKEVSQEGWSHKSIKLKPQSTDSIYKDIILNEDDLSELKVVGIFVAVL